MTPQLAQLARYVVKENFDFGFATVDHETYNESELEKALHDNITALLTSTLNFIETALVGILYAHQHQIVWPSKDKLRLLNFGNGVAEIAGVL